MIITVIAILIAVLIIIVVTNIGNNSSGNNKKPHTYEPWVIEAPEKRAGRGGPVPAGHGQPGDDPRQAPVLRRRIPCPVPRRSSLSAANC